MPVSSGGPWLFKLASSSYPAHRMGFNYLANVVRYAPPAAFLVLVPVGVRESLRPGGFLNAVRRFGFNLGHTPPTIEERAERGQVVAELPAAPIAVALPPMWARDP